MIIAGRWAPNTEEEDDDSILEINIPHPPSAEQVKEFEVLKVGGPSITNFRLDFRRGKTKGPWNRCAAAIFAEAFVKSKRFIRQKRTDVEKSFLSHLRTISKHYEKQEEEGVHRNQKERDENQRNRRRKRRGHVRSLSHFVRLTTADLRLLTSTDFRYESQGSHVAS
jgi:hypothetical protein